MRSIPTVVHLVFGSNSAASHLVFGAFIEVDGDVVCILASADDHYLFDRSHSGIQNMPAEVSVVLLAAGQALQPEKCAWMPVGGGSNDLPRCTGLTILGTRGGLANRARETMTQRLERAWAACSMNRTLFCR